MTSSLPLLTIHPRLLSHPPPGSFCSLQFTTTLLLPLSPPHLRHLHLLACLPPGTSPMQTHGGVQYQASGINRLFPLREAPIGEGRLTAVYVSFSSSDLCTWKDPSKGLKEDPEGILNLVQGIFHTLSHLGRCPDSPEHPILGKKRQ